MKEVTICNQTNDNRLCIFQFNRSITSREYKMIVDMMFSLAADSYENHYMYCRGIELEMFTEKIGNKIYAYLYHHYYLIRRMNITDELIRRWFK